MNELYERIESLCRDRGENITRMCRDSGVARGILTDLKMGRQAALSAKNLARIAEHFGVSVDRLLGTEDEYESAFAVEGELAEYLESIRTDPDLRMLFKVTRGATKRDIRAAVQLIETLKKNSAE